MKTILALVLGVALTGCQTRPRQARSPEQERARRIAMAEAMMDFTDHMEEARMGNRQLWEAQQPRTYRVRDRGFGNYEVSPAGYAPLVPYRADQIISETMRRRF